MYSYNCKICNRVVEVKSKPIKDTNLCRSCAAKERVKAKTQNPDIAECKFCGKLFPRMSNHQIYCKGPHTRICPICGKEYIEDNVENLKRPPVACSYECRTIQTRNTSMEKYGCVAPGNNPEAREKTKEAMLSRFGGYTLQSEELRNKYVETMTHKYGVSNPSKSTEILQKRADTVRKKYGSRQPFNYPESYEKQHQTILERYGVPYFCLTDKCQQAGGRTISQVNKAFQNKLTSVGISSTLEFKLGTRSFDIAIDDTNVLIEIDPTYTHNAVGNHWDSEGIAEDYHLSKTKLANEAGYRCIHIFDWDDQEKILNMFVPKKSIYARKCAIFILKQKVANDFLDAYHLQGKCRGQVLCLGLVYEGELYQVMTFGRSRYDKKFEVELLRLCTRPGYTVVGGASKLFQFAVKTYEIESVISYCDLSKFSGNVYEQIGMHLLRVTPPQEVWSRGEDKITANLLRQRGYDQLFGTNHGKGTSNELLMLEDGWLPVYDCGQAVYEYRSK